MTNNQIQGPPKSLTEMAKETLVGFAQDVSSEDILETCEEVGVSRRTIYRYLKGDVGNTRTAEKIIGFLKPIIERRKSTVAAQ